MSTYFPDWMGEVPRACAPWSKDEDAELLRVYRVAWPPADSKFRYYRREVSPSYNILRALATRHGRTVGGIVCRLELLDPAFAAQGKRGRDIERLEQEIRVLNVRVSNLKRQWGRTC